MESLSRRIRAGGRLFNDELMNDVMQSLQTAGLPHQVGDRNYFEKIATDMVTNFVFPSKKVEGEIKESMTEVNNEVQRLCGPEAKVYLAEVELNDLIFQNVYYDFSQTDKALVKERDDALTYLYNVYEHIRVSSCNAETMPVFDTLDPYIANQCSEDKYKVIIGQVFQESLKTDISDANPEPKTQVEANNKNETKLLKPLTKGELKRTDQPRKKNKKRSKKKSKPLVPEQQQDKPTAVKIRRTSTRVVRENNRVVSSSTVVSEFVSPNGQLDLTDPALLSSMSVSNNSDILTEPSEMYFVSRCEHLSEAEPKITKKITNQITDVTSVSLFIL